MCADCGCGDETGPRVTVLTSGHAHDHDHGHDHDHAHDPDHDHAFDHAHDAPGPAHDHGARPRRVLLEQAVLGKNDDLARANRRELARRDVCVVNLMSSPGSGKTSLLERTIRELSGHRAVAVIEGDQETLLDAERIRGAGCEVVQINTGAGCHLDADMLARGLDALDPAPGSLLFVENVGNLVCPALFDLGEAGRTVVISVTEGDDKPLKYPHMFAVADLVLINKTDLLPYVDFDVEACARHARSVNPAVRVLPVSVTTGDGLEGWYGWLDEVTAGKRPGKDALY